MDLAEIPEFGSPEHYATVAAGVEAAVRRSELDEIPVATPYRSVAFEEKWFRTPTGQVWRLVALDFPFKGVFLRVS